MTPLADTRAKPNSPAAFAAVVLRAFSQRRKMLRRGLGDWAALMDWDALGIPETARAEELSVEQFIAMADRLADAGRSEEHTSELQSLMRISYAVFCMKK